MATTDSRVLCVAVLFPFLMALAVQTVTPAWRRGARNFFRSPPRSLQSAITISGPGRCSDRLRRRRRAGILFALRQGGGALSAGDLLLFASVVVSAIGYTFSGRLTSQMPGSEVIGWVLVIALPVSIPAAACHAGGVTHIA